uniref:H15 domain-containing protein n=1 Tax=Sus scrofa TaxID=9823 RepID=A0A8D1CPG4_PIG
MQKDTSLPPPSVPLTSNAALGAGRQPSTSGLPSKSEPGRRASPKAPRKPSISKVILGVVANKGARNRVSLATLKKAVATRGYDMTRNAWRFKRVLKSLVDKGMLKQVTGKGASGSFLMGKKQDSKFKLKAKSQQRRQRQQRAQEAAGKHHGPGCIQTRGPRVGAGWSAGSRCPPALPGDLWGPTPPNTQTSLSPGQGISFPFSPSPWWP